MATLVSSGTTKVSIRPQGRTVIIGERCNALGYRNVAKAAATGKWSVIVNRAKEQLAAGAQIINVNMVGVKLDNGEPVSEMKLLPDACRAILKAVDAPLSIDFGSAEALDAAVAAIREMKGPEARPLINSNSAESGKRDLVFAVAAKYKLPLILLPCDDRGIPTTAEARIDVATKLIAHGEKEYGIPREDCIIDGIAIGVATDLESKPGLVTMETMRRVKSELGCSCMLGASNASFGLPQRKLFDTYYLAVAVAAGMNVALMDPTHEPSRWAILSADVLTGADVGCRNYLQAHRALEKAQQAAAAAAGGAAVPVGSSTVSAGEKA
ncbi:MAG TPA: dihydropteroate synthase [Planctomycetota bacterium]|nr:dihydropteroate synthase [Planctomycetota bacterium]